MFQVENTMTISQDRIGCTLNQAFTGVRAILKHYDSFQFFIDVPKQIVLKMTDQ